MKRSKLITVDIHNDHANSMKVIAYRFTLFTAYQKKKKNPALPATGLLKTFIKVCI